MERSGNMQHPLIAVLSCQQNALATDAMRETWLNNSPVEYKVFLGQTKRNRPIRANEVLLAASDDDRGLVDKIVQMIRWVREHGYTHVFKCDDDVYAVSDRLLKSGYEKHDYTGMVCNGNKGSGWKEFCLGGAGYWLSQKAMDAIVSAEIATPLVDGHVAMTLAAAGIKPVHDSRYRYTHRVYKDPLPELPESRNDIVSCAEFNYQEFSALHKQFLEGR
jgi:hypothetical protein